MSSGFDFEYKCSIGQDSHAFDAFGVSSFESAKHLILGGVDFSCDSQAELYCLKANSDGDVVLHALTNAVSGITCRNILGKIADEMCQRGITDSSEYLKVALKDLADISYEITHISFSIECAYPKISPKIQEMRQKIASLTGIDENSVGITATTGEGLTPFGQSKGISVFCILTCRKKDS